MKKYNSPIIEISQISSLGLICGSGSSENKPQDNPNATPGTNTGNAVCGRKLYV